eukprot:CAMPEP_0178983650 /NCGR_PEP_ID=MMETSP0795-20121207/1175_1 /TAXON_ID=88552 /ORGANISM="Amoebophrya sp., Strain Ameob2" /LENGTH=135 /DNA_ID=CAMNT_0020674441 /DNA_START=339 /DNA_END=745 /DNA_ORIENTATION=+
MTIICFFLSSVPVVALGQQAASHRGNRVIGPRHQTLQEAAHDPRGSRSHLRQLLLLLVTRIPVLPHKCHLPPRPGRQLFLRIPFAPDADSSRPARAPQLSPRARDAAGGGSFRAGGEVESTLPSLFILLLTAERA